MRSSAGTAFAVAVVFALAACRTSSAPPRSEPAPPPSPAPASPPSPSPAPRPFAASAAPRIDVHVHVEPGALKRAVALLGEHHIVHLINLSGGVVVGGSLERSLAEARQVGHTTVFVNPDFREVLKGGAYGTRMAAQLKRAHQLGARGVKITKGLGLGYVTASGVLLRVDDRGLDPLFEAAGALGMPVAIHTGDPKAFWRPPTADNERFDELRVHPSWSYYGAPVTWEDLYAQFERRVARHPRTTFIGVHFGNDPEDPKHVGEMLDRHPNLMIDTAARVPEIGRVDANHDAERMRAFFERYQDRILFGTDVGVGRDPADLMLGSMGASPPGPAEVVRFFDSTWRWFETADRHIPSPTPIQGRWDIDGVALPAPVLEKVYFRNAARLLGITLGGEAGSP